MNVKQIYTGCLAQGAYYIESNGEAAIIDPLREVQPYIEMAQERGAKIKYIFETHFHADFVSGHVTLSSKCGAPIVYGPTAQPSFDAIIAEDGQDFKVGDVTIRALHTPGHTMESTTYLLFDENGKEHAIFSGDTLFLGDVGRPDLAQKAAHMTQEELAGMLYDSLRTKIMTLPDDTIVYPGHGAGSACGKNMSSETVGTIAGQKESNYALRENMTREEFIKEVTDGLLPPPAYFPMNVQMNKEGYADVEEIINSGDQALDPEEFERVANDSGAVVLDVRHQSEFIKGFVPRSIFIGLKGDFAPWVGALIADVKQPILLVVEPENLRETITRLSRVGFDNVLGYLKGGFETWKNSGKPVDSIKTVEAANMISDVSNGVKVVDVRKASEYDLGHIENAINIPLAEINAHLDEIPKDDKVFLHCLGGYRSVIAHSILKSRGYHNFVDVLGGFREIEKADLPITEAVVRS